MEYVAIEKPTKNLNVWREAVELAKEIYRITPSFPEEDRFGITM
ncbi:MAG: four helix bundle protein [candidate division WOR-3 bacterium]